MTTMNPQDLKKVMSSGLLSFPVTDFTAQGDFNPKGYAARLEWLAPFGASALFAAGGTGEYFSLSGDEYSQIIKTAVDTCRGKVPIIAGAGGPTRTAIAHAQEAQRPAHLSSPATRRGRRRGGAGRNPDPPPPRCAHRAA